MEISSRNEFLHLNVGCGKYVLDGWFNIDIQASEKSYRQPDMLAPANKIPLPDHCAATVQAVHVIEHFYRWEVDSVLDEWKRLLKRNGMLILELPNLLKCCENILSGKKASKHPDQLGMWGLYGDPGQKDPYMTHRWGWTPATLTELLLSHGFSQIQEEETVYHPVGRKSRDMRLTGVLQ